MASGASIARIDHGSQFPRLTSFLSEGTGISPFSYSFSDTHPPNHHPIEAVVAVFLKATSRGNLKLAQNIRFCGATSLTSQTSNSISFSVSSFRTSTPNRSPISLRIFTVSARLSSLLVEKQYTCTMGNFMAAPSGFGAKRASWPA
ncbi:MAG: hypothetical protein Q9193_006958 [Seirophora villosa]